MKNNSNLMKIATEIGPLIAFFIVYKFYGIIPATIIAIISSFFGVAITYYKERRVATMPLVASILLLVFGGLTVISGDSTFIKIKVSIINLLFALALLIGSFMGKGLLKHVLGHSIFMEDDKWIILSRRWAYFFLAIAITNEIVWRNFSEEFWVKFKVFGIISLTIVFLVSQARFLGKNNRKI
jgi:intracellular septation protein